MTTSDERQAADAVAKARDELDRLLQIKALLKVELPAARAVLFGAEKRLRGLTKPTKAAVRAAELEALSRLLNEVKENA